MIIKYESKHLQDQTEQAPSVSENKDIEKSYLEREKKANDRINAAINGINGVIIELLRKDPNSITEINKKIKGVSTFSACWILLWDLENLYTGKEEYESLKPLLEEYRCCVNEAQQDKENLYWMNKLTAFVDTIRQIEVKDTTVKRREWDNPFNSSPSWWRRTFYSADNQDNYA